TGLPGRGLPARHDDLGGGVPRRALGRRARDDRDLQERPSVLRAAPPLGDPPPPPGRARLCRGDPGEPLLLVRRRGLVLRSRLSNSCGLGPPPPSPLRPGGLHPIAGSPPVASRLGAPAAA